MSSNALSAMRLTTNDPYAIHANHATADAAVHINLFPSRLGDRRRGGCLTIYLLASKAIDAAPAPPVKHRCSAACDTKVDLLIRGSHQKNLPTHTIAQNGICL